jgi:hypothetical protein
MDTNKRSAEFLPMPIIRTGANLPAPLFHDTLEGGRDDYRLARNGTLTRRQIIDAYFCRAVDVDSRVPPTEKDIQIYARLSERLAALHAQRHGVWAKLRRLLFKK